MKREEWRVRSTHHKCLDDAAARDARGGQHISRAQCCVGGGVGVALGVLLAVLADQVAAEVPGLDILERKESTNQKILEPHMPPA